MSASEKRKKGHRVRRGPLVILASFLIIWFVGVASGEPVRVLEQAVRICLSCIGIG